MQHAVVTWVTRFPRQGQDGISKSITSEGNTGTKHTKHQSLLLPSHPTQLVGTYALCFKTGSKLLINYVCYRCSSGQNGSCPHAVVSCSNKFLRCPHMRQRSCRPRADINSSHAVINSSPVHADECHADKGEVSPCSCRYKFLPRSNLRQFMRMHTVQRGEVELRGCHCPSFSEQPVRITFHRQPVNSASSMD